MDEAIIACRAILFVSVMLAFGASAFRLYAAAGSDPGLIAALDAQSRDLLLVSAIVGLLSALMLVPLVGGQMAGSMTATFEWTTISTVLLKTSFGRVWRWHLLIALLLVVACAIRRVQPGYRTALAGLSLASGHARLMQKLR